MRLGGAMISFILPKLILSVALDGILTFGDVWNGQTFNSLLNDRRQGRSAQERTCRNQTARGGFPAVP
jgi:hypothetical protein